MLMRKTKEADRSCRSAGMKTLASSIGGKDGAKNSARASRPASSRIITGVSTNSKMWQTIATPHVKFTERRFGGNTDEV